MHVPTALYQFKLLIIVEDNKIDGFIIKAFLKDLKFSGVLKDFTDPLVALSFLKDTFKKGMDAKDLLIFLDLHMPTLDGIDFLKALQQINPVAIRQVLILSSELVEVQKKVVEAFPVAGFISKPFNLEKLKGL